MTPNKIGWGSAIAGVEIIDAANEMNGVRYLQSVL
jgi:hypothetical protein